MIELKKGFQGLKSTPGDGKILSWEEWINFCEELPEKEWEEGKKEFSEINYDQLFNEFIPWIIADDKIHSLFWYIFDYYEWIGDKKISIFEEKDMYGVKGFEHVPYPEWYKNFTIK